MENEHEIFEYNPQQEFDALRDGQKLIYLTEELPWQYEKASEEYIKQGQVLFTEDMLLRVTLHADTYFAGDVLHMPRGGIVQLTKIDDDGAPQRVLTFFVKTQDDSMYLFDSANVGMFGDEDYAEGILESHRNGFSAVNDEDREIFAEIMNVAFHTGLKSFDVDPL